MIATTIATMIQTTTEIVIRPATRLPGDAR